MRLSEVLKYPIKYLWPSQDAFGFSAITWPTALELLALSTWPSPWNHLSFLPSKQSAPYDNITHATN